MWYKRGSRAGARDGRWGGWSGFVAALRRIAGMPDYQAHLDHLRHCHPDRPLPSQREYFEQFIKTRYGDGPTRCC